MREDIYYWKCDSPLSEEQKKTYNNKYVQADITDLVYQIAKDFFGKSPLKVKSTGSQGNHYAYIIKYDKKNVFFRADDGIVDDDYMEAENAAMELVRKNGIPVPKIYGSDTSKNKYPIRFQLLEQIPYKCLNDFHKDGSLDVNETAIQVGRLVAKLHQIKLDGFGFFNTKVLREQNKIVGLDHSHGNYFNKKLGYHLKYLSDSKFLSPKQVDRIESLIEKHFYLTYVQKGSLVHKDLAYWNILGTEKEVKAIVDWDDCEIGDPVDDLAIMRCFYNDKVFSPILQGYREVSSLPDNFEAKLGIYLIRNMLWKAVIRIFMGYFDMDSSFFLINDENSVSLEKFTYDRLFMGVDILEKI